ncbi:MAG TPA: type I polyketide synthase, partial [Lacipirellulaceae bacterium]|nr:type I polyketide synthase [Lacipirellulaceae bacterium]
MSDLAARVAGLSPAQRKLLEQRLKSQPAAPPPADGSIAIVGMACRFPSAPNLQAFWQLIKEGRSAASEVPADRWSADAFFDPTGEIQGKMSVRWAAFIDNPDQFDPQFFGITPREAVRMDPQQRLLLEVAWEAMENAGRPAEEFAGSRTGVFVGIGSNDYSKVLVGQDGYYQRIDAHMGTGNALSIAANRVSYVFDLHGPSAAIDTACSSSSLSIHFAVESLRRGESDAALAGGVNLILTPETTIAFSKARMLSPEGVCRPFDSRANGYVRGEGCGLVLLKRLEDAERDGDDILAVIRGTSVNQDGRTSGISAPNSQSQVACIRAALKQANLAPQDIDYIEAHGTGTPLGDPIEMMALSQIFGSPDSNARPVYVTSVKANIGHMETVSGVAGLIKCVLMMQHEEILPQANFQSLNPHIKLDGTRLEIPVQQIAWPRSKRPRIAGVSSFGFGGTNTHLIVEASPERVQTFDHNGGPATHVEAADRPIHLVKLSAKSEAALHQQAAQLADYLAHNSASIAADVCWSANTGWSDFNQRAIVTAADTEQLRNRLTAFSSGEKLPAGVKHATVRLIGRPNVAFLFTGQGSQYEGMGRQLYESQPVFRQALEKCDAMLRNLWNDQSLLDILYPQNESTAKEDAPLNQTRFTQPALFALEFALAELWASWGVRPDIVLGHSVGEYAAACVAGVMTLDDGLRLIAERARLMQSVKRHGKMAVVFASSDRVAKETDTTGGRVVMAVFNGPENIVISGNSMEVERLVAKFAADGIQTQLLNVSHAFHSPLMDEMLEAFEAFASKIKFQAPRVPMAANLTGELMIEAPTARYWRDHLRNAVQFAAGMTRIAEAKPAVVIEIGPSASLLGMGRRCEPKLDAAWLPSLREKQNDWDVISSSVAEFYIRGGKIDWRGWDRPWHRTRALLPNYPFQRSRHWFDVDPSRRVPYPSEGAISVGSTAHGGPAQPLLGRALSTIWSNTLFESRWSMHSPAYLVDHQVQGSVVTPAAAYIEQALEAASQLFGPGRHELQNLLIQQAMFLPEGVHRRVQVSATPEAAGESTVEIHSRNDDDPASSASWAMHATGTIAHESKSNAQAAAGKIDWTAVIERASTVRSKDEFYQTMSDRGLAYGPAFRMLSDLRRGEDDAIATVVLPEAVAREADAYQLHPVLGDALLQAVAGVVPLEQDGSYSPYTYMPVAVRQVRVLKAIEDFKQPLFVYAR